MNTGPGSSRRTLLPPLADAPPKAAGAAGATPDKRDGSVYVTDDDLLLAVDVALAARRPLLLRGYPGSGKSSFAAFLARNLGWRYYEHVVTERTRARDLLWSFDAVRKLADASSSYTGAVALRDYDYVEPGVLWWALNPHSAERRGVPDDEDPPAFPAREPNTYTGRDRGRAVVLIDEIDKADADVPNGLLVPLGSSEFLVGDTGTLVRQQIVADVESPRLGTLLVVVTTNEERDLPQAFVRRCVTYELPAPTPERLVEIGRRHLRAAGVACGTPELELLDKLAKKVDEIRAAALRESQRPASTAEFLDALFACLALKVHVGDADPIWRRLERLVLRKETTRGISW